MNPRMRWMGAILLCCAASDGQDLIVQSLKGTQVVVSPARSAATVVAFVSTLCPVSNAFNDRMSALYSDYSVKGVQFVFINSNANESAADVAAHAQRAGFPFEVYRDASNRIADRFGATATPEAFVIDKAGIVKYHGYIEDSINEARVQKRALRAALDAVLSGNPVVPVETKSFGCTIKRARRT